MSGRQRIPAEAAGHAVRPDDEVQVDAEDGDEPQQHQAETLQSTSHVLAFGRMLLLVTWRLEPDAEIRIDGHDGTLAKRSGGIELQLQKISTRDVASCLRHVNQPEINVVLLLHCRGRATSGLDHTFSLEGPRFSCSIFFSSQNMIFLLKDCITTNKSFIFIMPFGLFSYYLYNSIVIFKFSFVNRPQVSLKESH